ncbi:MAG: M23 family metallopeptidase [Archangium sp.]|nr:M23 family metallopeptidase [Archangium sp.]
MTRWSVVIFLASLVSACATAPAPKISFEDAAKEGRTTASTVPLNDALERFAAGAQVRREAVRAGSPMSDAQAQAWNELLDATDGFLARRGTREWASEAMRVRLRIEGELQADTQRFGDMPGPLADRVTTTVRALSLRIAKLAPAERSVDPHRFRWPLNPVVVSSPYGSRVHPIAGSPQFHSGIDLEAPIKTPVFATESGVVTFAEWNGGHGQQIELKHDARWTTRYSHLDVVLVKPGTVVKRGQRIGLVGETGLTTGPHLHFELRRDGDPLDPEFFLAMPLRGLSMGARP